MSTIADAARLARFLVAADNLARAVESGDCMDHARRPALLADYAKAREDLFGESPPGQPPMFPRPDTGRVR